MISYLISFVLCSGLLLVVYHVFLSQENLYRFNRFYLLFSLVFSMVAPAITITLPQHVVAENNPIMEHIAPVIDQQPVTEFAGPAIASVPKLHAPAVVTINYLPYILLTIYLTIALLLLIRFVRNIYRIKQKINENDGLNMDNAILVLLDEDITPHSFLNYIFINKAEYKNGFTEAEIICHEQAHVRQLHSVDVILIELLQIICWFNPLIPFYRKAMQLNHEFLADEAVVRSYEDTPAYQLLLVAKAQQGNSLYLTSQFNYLTIKKRLIMMTKNTSAKMALYKKLALLPVLAIALLLFSHKVMAYTGPFINAHLDKPVNAIETDKKDTAKPRRVMFPIPEGSRTKYAHKDAPKSVMDAYEAILKKYNIQDGYGSINGISAADTAKMHSLFIQMSQRQQDGQLVRFSKLPMPVEKNTVSIHWLTQWQKDKDYGVWVDGKRVKNEDLTNYKTADFEHYNYSRLSPVAIKNDGFKYQIDLMTKPYYAEYYKERMNNRMDKLELLQTKK
jgi:bla regulator protein BlaR1